MSESRSDRPFWGLCTLVAVLLVYVVVQWTVNDLRMAKYQAEIRRLESANEELHQVITGMKK